MENFENQDSKNIMFDKYKSSLLKKTIIKCSITVLILFAIFLLTNNNDYIFEAIGKTEFIIIYICGIVFIIADIIINYLLNTQTNELICKDIMYFDVSANKRKTEYDKLFPEEKKHKYHKGSIAFLISSNVLDYFMVVIIAVLTVIVLFTFVIFPGEVKMSSMNNTLFEGNKVITFNRKSADTGDIVVFQYDRDIQNNMCLKDKELLIKRVIAKGGDTFECISGKIYVNGIELKEDYVYIEDTDRYMANYNVSSIANENSNNVEVSIKNNIVPKGYYILLGDNRCHSTDSEEFGLVYYKQLIGVVKYYKNDFGWHRI